MYTVDVYQRLTHRYVGTYSHLDRHSHVARIKMTPGRVTQEGNGLDEGNTIVYHVRAPANVPLRKVMRAIEDTLSHQGCHHEYDCCGCASHYTRVKHLGNRRLLVRTRVSYNY